MKRFRSLLLVVAVAFSTQSLVAQDSQSTQHAHPDHLTCGQHEAREAFFEKFPEQREIARVAAKQLEAETESFALTKDTEDEILIIPVVFHVVHAGGEENISDEQIQSAVDVLNEDFSAANNDLGQVIDDFADIVGNVGIEFRLAKIDPDGNCTNGINRVFSETTNDGFTDMKDAAGIWDRSSYMNVWTCRQIGESSGGGITVGYTMVPSTVSGGFGQSYDGIVMRSDYTGIIGTSSPSGGRSLTHEVGHWINLQHTWGTSNSPGLPSNCSGGGSSDFVSDTPNTIGWTSCDVNGATCGSLDNVQNFMEYSFCSRMFTEGQANRMRAALNSGIAQRNQLHSPANLIETGVLEPDAICLADFTTTEPPLICEGKELTFEDLSFNGVENRTWTFEGGSPANSSEVQPTVVYNESGTYQVSLTVSNPLGEETVTKTGYVTVIQNAPNSIPIIEGFDDINALDESNDWHVINQDDAPIKWELTDQASFSGSQSVYVRGRNNDDFQMEELVSSTYDLSGLEDNAENAVLSFKYAHAKRNNNSDDQLRVRISRNCGDSWVTRLTLDIDELPTVSGNVSGQFIADSENDWEEVIIDNISPTFFTSEFRVKFEFTSFKGNNIYIDDINIFDPSALGVEESKNVADIALYPNPASSSVRLRIGLTESQHVRVELLDASGRVVQSPFVGHLSEGGQNINIELDESLSSGLYLVRLTAEDGIAVRKLIIE